MEEEILKIIYKYYPKNIDSNIPHYLTTSQFKNLKSSIKTAEENIVKWNSFLEIFRTTNQHKNTIEDWTQFFNYDACYSCRISYSVLGNEYIDIVVNVSIISNYYYVYSSKIYKTDNKFSIPLIDHDNIPNDVLKTIIESLASSFPNYKRFPKELISKIVPDVSLGNKNYGEVTFSDCIFTTHIW